MVRYSKSYDRSLSNESNCYHTWQSCFRSMLCILSSELHLPSNCPTNVVSKMRTRNSWKTRSQTIVSEPKKSVLNRSLSKFFCCCLFFGGKCFGFLCWLNFDWIFSSLRIKLVEILPSVVTTWTEGKEKFCDETLHNRGDKNSVG